MVRLAAEPLSGEAFAPFGRVVKRPSRPHDAAGPGWRWWAETAGLAGDGRPWGIGYLDLEPAPLRFDWAERHLRTLEAILPTARLALLGGMIGALALARAVDDDELSARILRESRAFWTRAVGARPPRGARAGREARRRRR